MKQWLQHLRVFLWSHDSWLERCYWTLWFVWTIICIPAFIFHELCHLICAITFGLHLETWEGAFYRFRKLKDGTQLTAYNLMLTTTGLSWAEIITNIAPVIGLVILLSLAISHHCYYMLLYIAISLKVFWLSKTDIQGIRESWQLMCLNSKVCQTLNKWIVRQKLQS